MFNAVYLATAPDGRPQLVVENGGVGKAGLYYLDLDQGAVSYYYASGQAVAQRIDDVLGETSKVYYLHHDGSGNLTEVTDQGQTILGRARYNGLGQVLTSTIPLTLTARLGGGELVPSLRSGYNVNPTAGLVYVGDGRYYDPALGLYLQPDPFGGAPEAPAALNHYTPIVGDAGATATSSSGKRQRHVLNLATDLSFLAGGAWYTQQGLQQALDYAAGYLSERSLVRFAVRASRHKLLTRLPQSAVELLGGAGPIRNLSANYELYTLRSGWKFFRGPALSRSVFDDLTEVIAGDARSTRWAGSVDDYLGHSFAWMGSRWFGAASAMGVEVLFQWFWPGSGDVWNYDKYGLTPYKFIGRTAVSAGGGVFSLAAVGLVAVIAAPVELTVVTGAAIAVFAGFLYEGLVKPNLYKWFNLYGNNER